MTNEKNSTGILKKIALIQKGVGVTEKSGYDDNNDYYFFTEADIKMAVSSLMIEQDVVNRIEIESYEQDNFYDKTGRNRPRHTALARVIFTDVEDGSEYVTWVLATGSDTGGDKGPRKLFTQIKKIAYIDTFNIVDTERGIDSDSVPEQEPVNMTEPTPAELSSHELKAKIGALIKNSDYPRFTADYVSQGGRAIAKTLYGAELAEDDMSWNKDPKVTAALLERLEKLVAAGEVV